MCKHYFFLQWQLFWEKIRGIFKTLSNIWQHFTKVVNTKKLLNISSKNLACTAWKVSIYGVISGPYFPVFELNTYLSVFSPNTGKYGPEMTPYLNTFYVLMNAWQGPKCTFEHSAFNFTPIKFYHVFLVTLFRVDFFIRSLLYDTNSVWLVGSLLGPSI